VFGDLLGCDMDKEAVRKLEMEYAPKALP